VPYLVQTLGDGKPLVRSIACWALGRYSGWCVPPNATDEHRQKFFVPTMEGVRAVGPALARD
jgi:transportin-1